MSLTSEYTRAKGAFYGNLVGDALGAPVEFQPRDSFPPVTGMLPCDTWGLPAGSFTDDGSLMLCMAASIVNAGHHDAANVLAHYLAWYLEGYMSVNGQCFDIGRTTRQAIEDYAEYGQLEARTTRDNQAGNGSVMRLAPIPVVTYNLPLAEIWAAGEASSKTTHGAAVAVWGCGFWSALTALAIQGKTKAELLDWIRSLHTQDAYPVAWAPVLECRFLTAARDTISSSGYVIDSCEAALWAFFRTESFAEGACMTVNLGRDADTVGAIYGILAGGYYGYEEIPKEWLAVLQKKEMVAEVWKDLEPYVGNAGTPGEN